MKEKLKPCPFCGSNNVRAYRIPDTVMHSVVCECLAQIGGFFSEQEAIKAWNKRYQPSYIDVREYYKE